MDLTIVQHIPESLRLLDVTVNLGNLVAESVVDRLYDYHLNTNIPFNAQTRDSILFASFILEFLRRIRIILGQQIHQGHLDRLWNAIHTISDAWKHMPHTPINLIIQRPNLWPKD